MSQSIKIQGEDFDALAQFFPYFELKRSRDGMFNISAEAIPNEVAAPFLRALMRREARLLKEDADNVTDAQVPRTPDQRRADAFVDLITSIAAASRYCQSGTSNPG